MWIPGTQVGRHFDGDRTGADECAVFLGLWTVDVERVVYSRDYGDGDGGKRQSGDGINNTLKSYWQ